MLRFVLAICLIANIVYAAWSVGALAFLGAAPHNPSEAWRLHRQHRGEALTIVAEKPQEMPKENPAENKIENSQKTDPIQAPEKPEPAKQIAQLEKTDKVEQPNKIEAPEKTNKSERSEKLDKSEKTICLQAGPFEPAQVAALKSALAASGLSAEHWSLTAAEHPGRWMVYVGPLGASAEASARAANIARTTGLEAAPTTGTFAPGVSLGRFSTPEGAQKRLAEAKSRAVAGARVVVERAPGPAYTLRLPRVSASLQPRVNALRPALAGRPMRNCVAGKS